MKQMAFWLVFAAAICALGLWPSKAHDAAELLPAQILVVDASQGEVTVSAESGVTGVGARFEDALLDMERHAPGVLFLDTAEYVVLTRRAWYLLPQIAPSQSLRPSARLVQADVAVEPSEALSFLQAHTPELTLADTYAALLCGQTPQTQALQQTEGGLCFAAN